MRQVAQQVRRDIEPPRYLDNLKLPRLQELCRLRRNADRVMLPALFQDRQAESVMRPSVQQFKGFAEVLFRLLGRLPFVRRFEDASQRAAPAEEAAAEALRCDAEA